MFSSRFYSECCLTIENFTSRARFAEKASDSDKYIWSFSVSILIILSIVTSFNDYNFSDPRPTRVADSRAPIRGANVLVSPIRGTIHDAAFVKCRGEIYSQKIYINFHV